MKKLLYVLTISLSLNLMSCGKDGDLGPEGPRGERGERGEAGIDGMDGSTVLNGTSAPKDTEGKNGDFYVNINTYEIYGPKKDNKWGNPKSLLGAKGDKGDKGDRGATGAKGDKGDKGDTEYELLSGNTDPTEAGRLGDFYINTRSKVLFQYQITGLSPVRYGWSEVAKLANTVQFTKTGVNLTGNVTNLEINYPFLKFNRGIANVYITADGRVWPIPGNIGISNLAYTTSYYTTGGGQTTTLNILKVSGSGGPVNSTVRIVFTEADQFETISRSIDFRNYHEVSRYFNLKD